jgi:hypothetical protein
LFAGASCKAQNLGRQIAAFKALGTTARAIITGKEWGSLYQKLLQNLRFAAASR